MTLIFLPSPAFVCPDKSSDRTIRQVASCDNAQRNIRIRGEGVAKHLSSLNKITQTLMIVTFG